MSKPLHDDMDAARWAKEFLATMQDFEDPGKCFDEDWIRTWFANAIMCGYDHGYRLGKAPAPKDWQGDHVLKLSQLILLTDPAVSSEEMNSLSAKQWTEYLRWAREQTEKGTK